jgi:GDP-L-fucose synthase
VKIVVTGAGKNGFLGHHVKEKFKRLCLDGSNEVVYFGSEIDLTDFNETVQMFREFKPDVVVHMAAVCGGILANKNAPADFLTKNTLMGIYMFEAARLYQDRYDKRVKIYTLGSVCAYPLNCPLPFKEDDLFSGKPEKTNFPYGQAKRTLLMLGQTYREQYGIGGAHLIPINLFGPKDHFDLVNSHVIPALINKFINAKEKMLPTVNVWGTGEATRGFLFASDCAEAIVKAVAMKLDTPLPINLGPGKDISIKDLAYLLRQLVDYKGEIVFTGEVSDGQPKRRLDVTRAKELLGFEAKTSLEDGLRKTIGWYLDNK